MLYGHYNFKRTIEIISRYVRNINEINGLYW